MRVSNVVLVSASLLLSACEQKEKLPFEMVRQEQVGPSRPCDPWEGRTAPLAEASVKAVLAGSDRKFLLMEVPGGRWIRIFEFSEDKWIEVRSSSFYFEDVPTQVFSFEDLEGRAQKLLFSSDSSWAGIARESESDQDFTKFEQWPGFEELNVVRDFKLDSMNSLRPRISSKKMRFYGTFGERNENHLLILDTEGALAGLYDGLFLGPSSVVSWPKHSVRVRDKAGGTMKILFGDGDDEEGGRVEFRPTEVDPTGSAWRLYMQGVRVPLLDLTRQTTPSDLLAALTFRHCDRAHKALRAKGL